MRKLAFCICENKGTDQLRGNCAADLCLCFCYVYRTIPLLSKPVVIFLDCTARLLFALVGNPKDRVSHDAAQLLYEIDGWMSYFEVPFNIMSIPSFLYKGKVLCFFMEKCFKSFEAGHTNHVDPD